MPQQDNQCVFMRGFTITVRENSLMQKIRGPVQLKVIGGSSRNAAPSFSSRSPYSSYQDNLAGLPSSGVLSSTGPVGNFDVPDYWTKEHPKEFVLEDNVELTDLPGRSTELLNPSARINEHLLTLHPHITVAVTHDEDWMEVTKDLPPDQWPDDCTLAAMVEEKRSGPMISTEDAEGHSNGFPEIPHDIWDQGITRGTDFEHDPSQYLTSSAGDEEMLFNDGASPYRYDYYLTPSNSLSPPSPGIPLYTPVCLPPPDIARSIPCRYFPACRYGSSCMFLHPQAPYYQGPVSSPGQYPAPYDPMAQQPYQPNYYSLPPPSFQPPNGVPVNTPPTMNQGHSLSDMGPVPAHLSPNGAPPPLPYGPVPPYSPVQFQGSASPGSSFQSLYISEQPSSPSSSIIEPYYNYPQLTLSTFQNSLPTVFDDHRCSLSPLSETESMAFSPGHTTSVSSLPDEEQNIGGGLDSLAGKRCTLPANAKRNLRSSPEHSVVGQQRKKINAAKKERAANGSEAKRIREQKFKCTFDGCTKTYTASHNFKDHLMSHRGMRLLCPHRDSGCREDYAQEVSMCHHHSNSHKDCTEHHRRADYVWASKEESVMSESGSKPATQLDPARPDPKKPGPGEELWQAQDSSSSYSVVPASETGSASETVASELPIMHRLASELL